MTLLHYLAYGSNLHPVRLAERVPSAKLLGAARLDGWRLAFHKYSWRDQSGKGMLYADQSGGHYAMTALYTLDARDKPLLDEFEGLGKGYDIHELDIVFDGKPRSAFTYLAQADYVRPELQPYGWYKDLVLEGARHLGFPEDYVQGIAAVEALPDPDPSRVELNAQLLARIRQAAWPRRPA